MEEDKKEDLASTIHEIQEEQEKLEQEENKEEVIDEIKEEPPVVPVEPPKENKKSKKKLIIIISIVVVVLALICVLLILLLGGKKKYAITFDTAGGNKIDSVIVGKGDKVPKPLDPTKEGYIFDGWEYNGRAYYFVEEVKSDMTIKAKWVVDTAPKEGDRIKVTFVYNNGDSDKVVEVLYNIR